MNSTELRKFGLIVGALFLLIGVRPLHHQPGSHRLWAECLGGALLALVWVRPALLRWPHRVWMKIGSILGTINSYVICTVLFYLVIVPVALIRVRLMGRNSLKLRKDPGAATYSVPVQKRNRDHFRFQF